jgi:hypothetical protein
MITGAYDLESWQAPLWLAGVVEATRTGPRTFSGTTDMRRGGPRHPGPAREEWEGRAKEVDNAAAVPFEAEVDGRGRLTRVTVRPEGGAPQTFVITRHGQRIELPHPRTGDVEIARDDVYG